MDGREREDRVDRSLTVAGKGHQGQLQPSTRRAYARWWTIAERWCRTDHRSALMPWTSELLASFAAAMLEDFAPSTVRKAVSAVKARHRTGGHPVPDDTATWHVLRGVQPSGRTGDVKGMVDIGVVTRIVEACDPTTVAGVRDRCVLVLLWSLYLRAGDLVRIDVGDLEYRGRAVVSIQVAGRRHPTDHVDSPTGKCTVLCPVAALSSWVDTLTNDGIRSGPLFRPIDRRGVIAQDGVASCGQRAPDLRLNTRSLSLIMANRIARSGERWCTPHHLRVGGALHDLDRGVPIREVAERGHWSMSSIGRIVGRRDRLAGEKQ